MAKFKVGDRVRLVSEYEDLKAGAVGTVLEESSVPFVSWDGFDGGHDGGGLTEDDSVFAVSQNLIELLSTATHDPLTILTACGIITQAQADAARALAGAL